MFSRSFISCLRGAGRRTCAQRVRGASLTRPLPGSRIPTPRRLFSDSPSTVPDNLIRRIPSTPKKSEPEQSLGRKTSPPSGTKAVRGAATISLEALLDIQKVADGRPNLWLRDACQCDRCIDPHSGQKGFATTQLSFLPRAKSVERHEDGSLTVVWANDPVSGGDDHTSVYPPNICDGLHRFPHRELWNRDIFEKIRHKCRVSYEDWIAGGSEFWAAMAALSRKGLVFVYDVPQGDEQAVERIGEQMGALQETFYGRTWDVVSKPQAENVAYTNQFLGLHQDLLYYPDPPRIQLLHCLANECEGGESLFADGVYAATNMAVNREPSFQALISNSTAYHYNKNGHVYYAERPIVRSKLGKRASVVENVWWSPPFQAPFPIDNSNMAAWYLAARQFQTEIERPENMVEYRLQPGECVVFDNWRVLHGRRQFNSSSGRRHLKGTYIDDRTYRAKLDDMPPALVKEHKPWARRDREFRLNKRVVQGQRHVDDEASVTYVAASLLQRESVGTLYKKSVPGLMAKLLGEAQQPDVGPSPATGQRDREGGTP